MAERSVSYGVTPPKVFSFAFFFCTLSIQLVYRMSMVLLRCPLVPEVILVRAPEVPLLLKAGKSSYDVNSVGATLNPIIQTNSHYS